MMDRLYETDSHMRTFAAHVLSCDAAPDGGFAVTLDRSCFYPEGGGQPSDTGTLGGANVLAVHEDGTSVLHMTDKPLPIGASVTGEIDWARRFAFMQNHSGEHIVSGLVHRLYGFDNVGFHMGRSNLVTIDFNGVLDAEALADVERRANEVVFANYPVETLTPSPSALAALSYRSKKALTGAVRIVTIDSADTCACCGTHVRRTGEIGLIKLLTAERHKGGTRVEMICGGDALADYACKHEDVLDVSRLLSAKPTETPQAVRALLDTETRLTGELLTLRKRVVALLAAQAEVLHDTVVIFDDTLGIDDARMLCTLLASREDIRTAYVFTGCETDGWRYIIVSPDARDAAARLNSDFNGKGGGKNPMAQGRLRGSRDALHRAITSKQ